MDDISHSILDALTEGQARVLTTSGNLLVIGRPGTGKTTVALLKAAKFMHQSVHEYERVLFLSFSNAAVQRLQSASRLHIPRRDAHKLQLATFHSFCHDVLEHHSAFAGFPRLNGIVMPHEVRALKAECPDIHCALRELEQKEGRVSFERLLGLTLQLFRQHDIMRQIYARAYPKILVDEYQDTSDDQDELLTLLGASSEVVYLGDPEQRIYHFVKGVRADRFERLIARVQPTVITLPTTCHRSGNSDLVAYSRAVLSGSALRAKPKDVIVLRYNASTFDKQLRIAITGAKDAVRKKCAGTRASPRIAVFAYTNRHIAKLSRNLHAAAGGFTHPFAHRVHVGLDELGPSWLFVLGLIQYSLDKYDMRIGAELAALARVENSFDEKVHKDRAAKLIQAAEALLSGGRVRATSLQDWIVRLKSACAKFVGDPHSDVALIIDCLRNTKGGYFESVVNHVDLRSPVARQEQQLVSQLHEQFANHGSYRGARLLGERYLTRESLLEGMREDTGITLMTLHKSKGREFDAVVIVDGAHGDSLVLREETGDATMEASRRLLSVAIAR